MKTKTIYRESDGKESDDLECGETGKPKGKSPWYGRFKGVPVSLALVFLLATLLRLYDLGSESLWLDEGYSVRIAGLSLLNMLKETATQDLNPPLYYLLLHWWTSLFGNSETAVRLISAAVGAVSIPAAYAVARRIFNNRTAIISALLLALSPFHINYSQEARGYSLMVLLALLSFYYFVRLVRNEGSHNSIGYVISTVLLLYTHAYGVFLPVAQSIYLLIVVAISRGFIDGLIKRWLGLQVATFGLFLPWMVVLVTQMTRVGSGEVQAGSWWIPKPTGMSILSTLYAHSGSVPLLMAFILLVFMALVPYDNYRRLRKSNSSETFLPNSDVLKTPRAYGWLKLDSHLSCYTCLLLWLLVPILIPFILSQFLPSIFWVRYTIIVLPALIILVARAIDGLSERRVVVAAAAVVVFLTAVASKDYYASTTREPWRTVVTDLESSAKPRDIVLFNVGYTRENIFDYYAKRRDIVKGPFPVDGLDVDERNVRELKQTIDSHDRVWLVFAYTHDRKGLMQRELVAYNFEKLSSKRYSSRGFPDIEVVLYRKTSKRESSENR